MKKFCAVIFLALAVALANETVLVTSTQLIEQAKFFDRKIVRYDGEAIGDILPRGKKAWLNVYDGANAIGVFADKEMLKKIKILGNYQQAGDKISVHGEFRRACPEHGGDLDIHARQIEIISAGYKLERNISRVKIFLALAFSALALWLFLLNRKLQ